jgi:hypothetical protein
MEKVCIASAHVLGPGTGLITSAAVLRLTPHDFAINDFAFLHTFAAKMCGS